MNNRLRIKRRRYSGKSWLNATLYEPPTSSEIGINEGTKDPEGSAEPPTPDTKQNSNSCPKVCWYWLPLSILGTYLITPKK